jgi:NitT/TauT family transport system substrate-binding protein
MGEGVKDRDAIGIEFADGTTVGNKDNVKLRFDAVYAGMAADGKL